MPPIALPLPTIVVDEGELVKLTVGAFDPDGDGSLLRFELGANHPVGSQIDPNSGEISWLTGEIHGPGQFTFPVLVTDSGSPAMSTTVTYSVRVNEVNQAPVLGNVADQFVSAGETLQLTIPAADLDLPTQALSFVLGAGSPADAVINRATGELSWNPSIDQEPGAYQFSVMVADDGSPALSSVPVSFGVTVTAPVEDVKLVLLPSDGATLGFQWASVVGSRYSIQILDAVDSNQWIDLGTVEGNGESLQFTDPIPADGQRFYRVVRLNP